MASLTSTAFAEFKAPLPEFKKEKQLAEWRAEKAAEATSQGNAAEETAFYTGKPYLASSGGYVFKYRSYSPELARWTSEDPSGFPDGANNLLYVNNISTHCIDIFGLNVYMITNQNSVAGAGHSAIISGSGSSYTYQSYGSGSSGLGSSSASSVNNLTTQSFSSLGSAINYASSSGFTDYNEWDSTSDQDSLARQAMRDYSKDGNYNATNHNCQGAVNSALRRC